MDGQKPGVGRIVHYHPKAMGEAELNGASAHPAIITRVWSDDCVNLMVFFDAHMTQARTSCSLASGHWTWPPRV